MGVNLKMSGGNNAPRGARAQEILITVLHTAPSVPLMESPSPFAQTGSVSELLSSKRIRGFMVGCA